MEKTGRWSEISPVNIEFCNKAKDEKILSSKEEVVLVFRVGMHAEGNVPQASIVERKSQGRGWPPVAQIKVEVTHNDKFTWMKLEYFQKHHQETEGKREEIN